MSDLPRTFVAGFHDEEAVRRMTYSPLGQTGLKVSKLSLGTGSLSNCYGDFDEEEAIRTVQEAIRQGVNYIDTGYWYGQGRAETVLGKALKDVPRQAYYIGTKCGRYEKQPGTMFDFSSDKTLRNFNDCLKRLQLDYVDVIQIHDIEFAPNMDRIINETLPSMEIIVKSGKATYIGITGYPVSTLKECVQKSQTIISTILSYTRLTLIDDTLLQFIPYFRMQGLGIINASGPSMGLLTNSGPQPWHPASDEIKNICKQAAAYCQEKGVELGRLAMDFVYKQPGIATNLVGMNTIPLLESNLDVLLNGLSDLEQQVLKEIQERFFSKLQKRNWENVELETYRLQVGGW